MSDFVLPLATFALVMSITPGPNNLMLMASGANFGFRRTIPHLMGVALGFIFMAIVMGLGLAEIFTLFPWLRTALMVVSVVYLLWLAWKIANAAAPLRREGEGTPITFFQAVAFQWVNPKAIAMAVSAITIYAPTDGALGVLAVALVFGAVNLPSVSTWCIAGIQLRRFLTNPRRLRIFNWTMAALLVASLYPVLIPPA